MTATALSPSGHSQSAGHAYQQALHLTLQQAVDCHHANRLQDAGQLYRSVLTAEPEHPEANHNLGVLLLEERKPDESLPHFEAALAAMPDSRRYWLSYIQALLIAGRTELAQRTLAFSREHGLEGAAVEDLALMAAASPAESRAGTVPADAA